MKVLIVGGSGYVGSVIREVLEAEHECYYYDLKPTPGREDRTVVASVIDEAAVCEAVKGMDCVLYLAMGVRPGTVKDVSDVGPCFDVHTRGHYLFLRAGMKDGVRKYIYASSLSVYEYSQYHELTGPLTEDEPATAFDPYGLSKRLGEYVCQAAVERQPEMSIFVLRLNHPTNEQDWAKLLVRHTGVPCPLAPNDTRRLFLAALRADRLGAHIVHTSGDTVGEQFSNARVLELLGWKPQGN